MRVKVFHRPGHVSPGMLDMESGWMIRIVIAVIGVLVVCAVGGFFSLGAFPPALVQQDVHRDITFAAPVAAVPAALGTPAPLPVAPLAPVATPVAAPVAAAPAR